MRVEMSVAKILKRYQRKKIAAYIHTSLAQHNGCGARLSFGVESRGKVWKYTWFNVAYIQVEIVKSDQILALRRAAVLSDQAVPSYKRHCKASRLCLYIFTSI